ncbi:MAG: ChaN family lipoprotein [Armatimonadetes bacterium]|nr:ChaN family lipoprotein [Armatimonadota bacterium]
MLLSSIVVASALQNQKAHAPKVVATPPAEVDPLKLNLWRAGQATVEANNWYDLTSGKESSLDGFLKASDRYQFIFLGESHDDPVHHQIQAKVIDGLVKRGRNVTVGFEMFTRPNQPNINAWTLGKWSDDEFIENSNWKKEWGFPYPLYKPIFDVIKKNRLPMVALNVPRDWVRSVGKSGLKGLTADEQSQIPTVRTDNASHRVVFNAMMGGHPMQGSVGENMYAAQCLWDEGMADTAIKYVTGRYGSAKAMPPHSVFVIVAGMGHGLYKQGINWRIWKRTGMDTLTLINIEASGKESVSRGIADFTYVSPDFDRKQ